MSIKSLLTALKNKGIDISLHGNDLEINYEGEALSDHILKELKENKKDIIDFLKQLRTEEHRLIPAKEKESAYPLSSSQRRLWVLSQFEGGSIAYNLLGAFVFEGNLCVDALTQALNTIIERHESLRTVFKEDENGEVKQSILSSEELGFGITHHQLKNGQDREEQVKELVQQEFTKPFDLATGPLLRVGLYQIAEKKWIFNYIQHHIISDGWSIEILIRELLVLYNAYREGKPNPFPPLRIQYKDYAAWQQQQLITETYKAHRSWWLQQFSGELPVLQLPADRIRPAVKTYNGDVVHTSINKDLLHALKTRVNEHGGTLFMGLLAVVNALLYRYTGQEDIIIGSPIAGREHIDLEDQIGLYVNTVALRTHFKGTNSFEELLAIIKQMTVGAYEHQAYPFDDLVDELQLQRDMSRSALFDVMVILQNIQVNKKETGVIGDLNVQSYTKAGHVVSKFDITLNCTEIQGELHISIEFNKDIYNKTTIERLARHFEQLLTAIVQAPATPLNQLDYLNEVEKQQLLFEFNDTTTAYPQHKTIINLFEEQVAQTPERMAVIFGDNELTYATLNAWANRLANYLRKQHTIDKDDLIGVQLPRSEWLIIALLGVLKSGGAYVPIDPAYPKDRIEYMLQDARCKLVIDEKELTRFKAEAGRYKKEDLEQVPGSDHLAYVLYTSGSTGKPKGVMIGHNNVNAFIHWCNRAFAHTGFDVIYATTSICFDLSVFEIFYPLCVGKKLRILNSALFVSNYLGTDRNILLNTVPGVIGSLLDEQADLSNVQALNMAGEPIPSKYIAALDCYKTEVRNLYGPSEATTYSTVCSIKDENLISIGRPIDNTRIYILDEVLNLQPVGVVGEVCIAGAGLSRGYLHRPELTAEKFIANPFINNERFYKTGDLGRWLPDGNIEFIGRKDDQVKIRGYRIELGEIENALRGHQDIESAVVVAITGKQGAKELAGYVTSCQTLTASQLRAFLNDRLPAYMVPDHFVQLQKLPITPNGKIDKKALPYPDGIALSTNEQYIAPCNEIEQTLVSIWQQVTGKERIGIRDNFFDIGGNSMKLLKMNRLINKAFGRKIPVVILFRLPNIKDLAGYLSADVKNETAEADEDAKMAVDIMEETFRSLNVVNDN
jgi:amino acid adenylation domain-containing protein